ncbi:MAG: sigma-70 family RNA polymerase sigma factor [Nannocystaceae bacterium]
MTNHRHRGAHEDSRAPSHRSSLADAMERYIAGDLRAFDRLYRAIEPRVRRQIRAKVGRHGGNDTQVDDLVQLTMLRAHAARGGYARPAGHADDALVSWFCAIARNTATNHLRAQYRDRLQFGEGAQEQLGTTATADADAEQSAIASERDAERRDALLAAIAALPPGQRAVVHLHKLEGLPIAEVSRRLGVRDGAVRVRAHRAYESLRNRITHAPATRHAA